MHITNLKFGLVKFLLKKVLEGFMKKFFITLLASLLVISANAADKVKLSRNQKEFQKIIGDSFISSQTVEYKDIYPEFGYVGYYKGEITYEQMQEDLDHLEYLLRTAYAGYKEMLEKNFDFFTFSKKILKRFAGQAVIQSRDFGKAIYQELSNYIEDSHLTIFLGQFQNQHLHFAQHFNIYYTDVFVQESEKDRYPEENLFPYFHQGKLCYRLGKLSPEPVEEVLGHKVKLFPVDTPRSVPYYFENESSFSAYIRLEAVIGSGKAAEISFDKFMTAGKRYMGKSFIIVDLRTNQGGFPKYGYSFASSFYFDYSKTDNPKTHQLMDYTLLSFVEKNYENSFKIDSPATSQWENGAVLHRDGIDKKTAERIKKIYNLMQKEPQMIYSKEFSVNEDFYNKMKKANTKILNTPPVFNGKFIVLQDRNSSSASEEFIRTLSSLFGRDRVIVAGENSNGCITYGAMMDFNLPNSFLTLHIAGASLVEMINKLEGWHGEGKGIYPDYWSTDQDMAETVYCLTKDEAIVQYIKG